MAKNYLTGDWAPLEICKPYELSEHPFKPSSETH